LLKPRLVEEPRHRHLPPAMDPAAQPRFQARRLALKLEPPTFYLEYTDDVPKTRVRAVGRCVATLQRSCARAASAGPPADAGP
jgi:hypothetical protein